ncbi:hypothetical protein ABIA13_001689 [Sinorhizobium fredii]
MAGLDGAGGDSIGSLETGHDLVGGEDLDLEIAVGRFGYVLGEDLRAAKNRVEPLGEGRRQAPGDFRTALRDGRRRERRCSSRTQPAEARVFNE